MSLRWLHDGEHPELPPKADGLARAAAAALPVPRGFACALAEAGAAAPLAAASELVAQGKVIVRSALVLEDGERHSGAGLGESVGDVDDLASYRAAVSQIAAARARAGMPTHPRDGIIVQRQVDACARAVLASEHGRAYLEEFDGRLDAFASGASPRYSGPLAGWPHRARASTMTIAAAASTALPGAGFGLDLELAIDRDDTVFVVQARPLTAPLFPDWESFVALVAEDGDVIPGDGTWQLDAEHNPQPLSFAHAWLVRWLASQRPRTGGLRPLGGWLYTRTLVRELAATAAPVTSTMQVLARLRDEVLPAARARLAALEREPVPTTAAAIDAIFARGLAAFLAMIDVYTGELIPARAAAHAPAIDPADPFCLRGREAVLDVLPVAWDVASPSLAGEPKAPVGLEAPERGLPLPTDERGAATLLTEWDDHLFALGLRAARSAWRAAGAALGLGDDVFALAPDELAALAQHGLPDVAQRIAARRERQRRAAALRVPSRIVDGAPAGVPTRWLRGFALGSDFTGPLAPRPDLAALLASPPPTGAVVALPALTAQAAVVLARLEVRAVVCEHGGALGHGALMARELGLSALLGARGCMAIAEGTRVRIDVRSGALRRAASDGDDDHDGLAHPRRPSTH
ncbi:MAG: hypothetical protein IPK74_26360 [Deltaproteobacteria bacterium]|nr:hypothetical protein [Deltaproteobacteria bacterium]